MACWRSDLAWFCLGLAVATAVLLPSAEAASAQGGVGRATSVHYPDPGVGVIFSSCERVFWGGRSGSLVSTTSAGPNGSTVVPGQTITVTITWNPRDFWERLPFETHDCVAIGSRISRTLSQERRLDPAAGTDHFSFVVPRDGTGGNQMCEWAAVSGLFAKTEKTAVLCYVVMGAETPEVPQPLMLPITALGLMGGSGLWVARRRRQRIRT